MSDIIKKIPLPELPLMYPQDTEEVYFILSKDNWSNSIPSTYSIIMSPPEENVDYGVVGLVSTGDDDADIELVKQFKTINYEFSSDGILTFIAVHEKPIADLPIVLCQLVEEQE